MSSKKIKKKQKFQQEYLYEYEYFPEHKEIEKKEPEYIIIIEI